MAARRACSCSGPWTRCILGTVSLFLPWLMSALPRFCDHKRIFIVSTSKKMRHYQDLTEELCRLAVPALSHVVTSQHELRSAALPVPGGLAPVPLPQGSHQAQLHRACTV